MKLDRREFIASTLAGAGALLVGGAAFAQAGQPNPYQMVPLGKTGLKVSRISMGTGMRGGNRQSNHTRMGYEALEALVHGAYERGVRMFDMADMYGTHQFISRALKKYPRDSYLLVSKIWVRPGALPEKERPDADVVIDRFRKELDTDYVDLVLIHCMTDEKWTDQQRRNMDIMTNLKSRGVIRSHGVSIHSLPALKVAAVDPWVESVHARINAYGVAMDGKPEEVAPVLQLMRQNGKGVVGMKLVGEGRFRDEPERKDQSIKYVLGLNCVDTMCVGFEKIDEVDDFAMRLSNALKPA
jgi:aryl-alcohol dehydrogenase-like predicted oxidoreductase